MYKMFRIIRLLVYDEDYLTKRKNTASAELPHTISGFYDEVISVQEGTLNK